jgi:RecA/RadA recombinase
VSVEAYVLASLVEQGSPREAFRAGIGHEDFEIYEDEWLWVCDRAESQKPINSRLFKQAFPDFDFIVSSEKLADLLDELKQERAYVDFEAALQTATDDLSPENALERVSFLRDRLGEIMRLHAEHSDVLLKSDWKLQMKHVRSLAALRKEGKLYGIPTGFKNLDHHWGGLVSGRLIVVLGRPGDSKSFFIAKMAVSAMLDGRTVAMFSPEMNQFEHSCRVHTLLSADPKIQEACGLKNSFRNRALMQGEGFNQKKYKAFMQYVAKEVEGEIVLFTNKHRRAKISPAFIESRVEDIGADIIFIDPIYKLRKPNNRQGNRLWELQDLTDEIQGMGESFNVPIVMSNQAHRQQGNKGDAPHMDQSFGSDAPAQEGDHVIGVKYFEEENKLILRCTKSRFGGKFRVDVNFRPNIGLMEDVTTIRGNYFKDEDETDPEVKKELEEVA